MADIITINDASDLPDVPPGQSMGLVPRDFRRFPVGHLPMARPFDLALLTDQQIEEAIRKKDAEKSWLQDIRDRGDNGGRIKSLDQNGQGYCWAYSSTAAAMLARSDAGLPYKRLSGHMIACIIKNYRDEGGWNSLSCEFAAVHGIASVETWPEKSMSRSNDTPAMREEARTRRVMEYMDLDDSGANLKRQLATALCNNMPCMVDYNWWSHSITACRLVSWNPFKIRIWNSWTDSWSDAGMGDLEGSRAIPNGSIAVRVTGETA